MNRSSLAVSALAALLVTAIPFNVSYADNVTDSGRKSPQVSIHLSDQLPTLGDRIKVSGKVSPAPGRGQVRLQVHYKHARPGWKTLATKRLDRNGKYLFRTRAGSLRERVYRVIKLADGRSPAIASHGEGAVVFSWQPLKIDVLGTSYVAEDATMAGHLYPASYTTSGGPGSVLVLPTADGEECRKFDATFGLDDRSPAGSTATINVYGVDGADSRTYAVGSPLHMVTDLSTTPGPSLLGEVKGVSPGGTAVIGSPKVLCNYVID